ncbi:MAG: xanthine dehydrogenase accessory protein XdhC, partial [Kocuria sp.]|nr:xanthine dehydrogenase accessory protein XdhC [Kocuria sp.]
MEWLTGLESLTSEGTSGILVTLISVRGHAPRAAGTKMVVSAERTWDTIGGGNRQATVTPAARRMRPDGEADPPTEEIALPDHTP